LKPFSGDFSGRSRFEGVPSALDGETSILLSAACVSGLSGIRGSLLLRSADWIGGGVALWLPSGADVAVNIGATLAIENLETSTGEPGILSST
jgi:hypothetical protein